MVICPQPKFIVAQDVSHNTGLSHCSILETATMLLAFVFIWFLTEVEETNFSPKYGNNRWCQSGRTARVCMNRQSRDEKIYFGNTEENNSQNVPFHNCLAKIFSFLPHLLLSLGQWLRVLSNMFISTFKFEKEIWNKDQAECLAGGA